MVGTAFLGYTLPWGQMSFWGATVITNILGAVPLVGDPIKQWLMGGFSIDNPTLNRFFSLHYLLPFVIFGVTILHVWALHVSGQNNPTGVDVKSSEDTVAFTPYATVKDLFALGVFLLMFAAFIFYMPDALGHADNYIPGNPLVTPPEIVPEWYLLPFYAILRAITFNVGFIDSKLGGVIAMFGAIAVLFALPWLDTSKVRSMRYRPWAQRFFVVFAAACFALGWCGGQNPSKAVYQGGDYTKVVTYKGAGGADATRTFAAHTPEELAIEVRAWEQDNPGALVKAGPIVEPFKFTVETFSQLLTAYYFAFFLIILPLLGLREVPRRVPDTIAKAVLDGHKAAAE
jgi:ubiquinol-cytochrome c reductase cytochrome b subunit